MPMLGVHVNGADQKASPICSLREHFGSLRERHSLFALRFGLLRERYSLFALRFGSLRERFSLCALARYASVIRYSLCVLARGVRRRCRLRRDDR
jgi:hypothetical protein